MAAGKVRPKRRGRPGPNARGLALAAQKARARGRARPRRANSPRPLTAFEWDGKTGTLISIRVESIAYRHRLAAHRGTYEHPFDNAGVELWGLPNGALLIRHPRFRLWEDRIVGGDE